MDQKLFILIWYYHVVRFRGLKSKWMYLCYHPFKSHAKHVIIFSLIKYCRSNFKHWFFKGRKMWLWLWSSHHLWTRQLAGSMRWVMVFFFYWFPQCFLKTCNQRLITVCIGWAHRGVKPWPKKKFQSASSRGSN